MRSRLAFAGSRTTASSSGTRPLSRATPRGPVSSLEVFIDVRLDASTDFEAFSKRLAAFREVADTVHMTGPFDALVHAFVPDTGALDTFLGRLKRECGAGQTQTRVALRSGSQDAALSCEDGSPVSSEGAGAADATACGPRPGGHDRGGKVTTQGSHVGRDTEPRVRRRRVHDVAAHRLGVARGGLDRLCRGRPAQHPHLLRARVDPATRARASATRSR